MKAAFIFALLLLVACGTVNKKDAETSKSDSVSAANSSAPATSDVSSQGSSPAVPGPTVQFEVRSEQVGGGQDVLHAVTYAEDGTQVEDQVLGYSRESSGPDGSGEDYNYNYDSDKRVISVITIVTDWDEATQEVFTYTINKYYYLNRDASITEGRLYADASRQYLSPEDLQRYSKFDLMIMRNEIFASRGYRFKFKELKDYFDTVRWYTPLSDDVNDLLSKVEIANIKVIKAVEDSK